KGLPATEAFAGNTQGDPAWENYMHTADAHLEARVPVRAGVHKIGVSFVRQYWKPEGIYQAPQTGYAVVTNVVYFGDASVESVMIDGPYNAAEKSDSADTPSRRKIFICRPKDAAASGAARGGGAPQAERAAGRQAGAPSAAAALGSERPPELNEDACARKILTTLATRAYRRPITEAEIRTLLEFYRQ